jgi:hypothetical protein
MLRAPSYVNVLTIAEKVYIQFHSIVYKFIDKDGVFCAVLTKNGGGT